MAKPRSPALGLGVFFILYFTLRVFGQEESDQPAPPASLPAAGYAISSEGGSLWVEEDHGSGFWGVALSLNCGRLYGAIGAVGMNSNLPAFDTNYTGAWFKAGVKAFRLGLDVSGGLFHRDAFNGEALGAPVSSDGADGYFLRIGLPLRLGDWSVGPSFLFAQGFWEEGDLYWFFGKPQLPALFAPGVSVAFREEQHLYFHYLSLKLLMLNLFDEKLFSGHVDGFVTAYRWTFNRKPFSLDVFVGWLSVSGSMEGRLNSENQPYLLFPYTFYDASFNTRFHGLFGVLTAEYRRGFFRLNTTIGSAQALSGEINLATHTKQKKLPYMGILIFDGREEHGSWPLNSGRLGGVFLLIKGGLEALPMSRNRNGPRLAITVGKLFALPWGYESLLNSSGFDRGGGGGEKPRVAGDGLNLISIVLSGLSFCCAITW
jgi:hypothetical protein